MSEVGAGKIMTPRKGQHSQDGVRHGMGVIITPAPLIHFPYRRRLTVVNENEMLMSDRARGRDTRYASFTVTLSVSSSVAHALPHRVSLPLLRSPIATRRSPTGVIR